jgi:pimeloyl-ACP methyl ester carboxylesterase
MLSNRSFVRGFIAGTILALSILAAAAESPAMTASKTGYAPVNGLNLYYEIYGAGEPLVLLHGGAGAIEIFSSIMPDLSRNHQVIAVDLQAHGRTAPTLLVFGDADAVRPAHAVEFFELLGGGKRDGGWDGSGMSNARLAILSDTTRYTIFSSSAMTTAVVQFLDTEAATTK